MVTDIDNVNNFQNILCEFNVLDSENDTIVNISPHFDPNTSKNYLKSYENYLLYVFIFRANV